MGSRDYAKSHLPPSIHQGRSPNVEKPPFQAETLAKTAAEEGSLSSGNLNSLDNPNCTHISYNLNPDPTTTSRQHELGPPDLGDPQSTTKLGSLADMANRGYVHTGTLSFAGDDRKN